MTRSEEEGCFRDLTCFVIMERHVCSRLEAEIAASPKQLFPNIAAQNISSESGRSEHFHDF